MRRRAEEAQRVYEEGRAALFRPDGSSKFSQAEQKEREDALRSDRHRMLSSIEREADEEMAAARQRLDTLQASDPTTLLGGEELEKANQKRAFVNDDVAALSEDALEQRLRAVLASRERASMFTYWRAAIRRRDEILESRREELRGRGMPESIAGRHSGLDAVLEELEDALLGPEAKRKVKEVEELIQRLSGARSLAWSLKRGGRNPAQVHINRTYRAAEPLSLLSS